MTPECVFQKMKPMLTLPIADAENLCEELEQFFEYLVQNTEYAGKVKKIFLAGSLREKLKAGRLDEADVQIELTEKISDCSSVHGNLVLGLTKMKMKGLKLRPICTANPWEFIWEGPGPIHGLKVSVDVVPMYEGDTPDYESFTKQGQILENPQMHNRMYFLNLRKVEDGFCLTYFAFEADIMDSLPTGAKLGILIVKALTEAYYWHKGMHSSPRRKPITSNMVKTAVFQILANREGPRMESWSNAKKLKFNPSPRWMVDTDLQTYRYEGRLWAWKILKTLLIAGDESSRGMNHYWANDAKIVIDPFHSYAMCFFLLNHIKQISF